MATAGSIQQLVESIAVAQGFDVGIAMGVAQAESNFSATAVSPAGAIGVMQLMPQTAAQLGVNPSDPTQNIQGGINYLNELYGMFNGYWPDALAAYNWGPGNVQALNGSGAYPASVASYVNNVLSLAASYDGTSPAALAEPSIGAEVLGSVGLSSLDSWLPTTTLGYAGWAVGSIVLLSLLID